MNKQDQLFWNHQFCKWKTIDGNTRVTKWIFCIALSFGSNYLWITQGTKAKTINSKTQCSAKITHIKHYVTIRLESWAMSRERSCDSFYWISSDRLLSTCQRQMETSTEIGTLGCKQSVVKVKSSNPCYINRVMIKS